MKKTVTTSVIGLFLSTLMIPATKAQVIPLQDYNNNKSAPIGTYQGIPFREAGFSALYPIAGTNGREFWTCSDRGVNIDAASANPSACRPTYDKIFPFPAYVPKIHRIRVQGDSIQIVQSITMKRPNGSGASGLMNPTYFGSTATEVVTTDTVLNCLNFSAKTAAKDTFGIDAEGLAVDKEGNFWICEEGGPTIWKLSSSGVLLKRFSPYATQNGHQSVDVAIDTVFKYRKNNRGFEGITITPNGKIYAIIQSPLLYPNKSTGEGTRIHRILEIDPQTNTTRMFAYLNDGIIGASGANQIRLRDWKIGDLAAINNEEFLVIEAALRGSSDFKRIYKINIHNASAVSSALYSGKTLEGLVDAAGLAANGIVPVSKTLFMDLLANAWPASFEKAEGIAIINDSTIAVCNDNDYGVVSTLENGIATATGISSHLITYRLRGANIINGFVPSGTLMNQGITGLSSSQTPYLHPLLPEGSFTSILTVADQSGAYKMCGIPDGLGALDNGDSTFTLYMNHEIGKTLGAVHAHGSKGAFVSKWIINKSDLSVLQGEDLIKNVNLWNGSSYSTFNASNPSSLAAFSRFCSADIPALSAFYNQDNGLGTMERIFMTGEESGTEGRVFAAIVTGPNTGTAYELPYLGKAAWENAVASPIKSNKTLVGLLDDGLDGQVYFYIGQKTNSGNEIEKAGLQGGHSYGVKVSGFSKERVNATTINNPPAPGTRFSLIDMGTLETLNGADFNTASNTAGITSFSRPEDGHWDPQHPEDFYFITTDQLDKVYDGVGTQIGRTRVWKLHFDSIQQPKLGGTIEAVIEGTEGVNMLDNMTLDRYGHILLQEDVGNTGHNGKIWQYNIATDELTIVAKHNPARFGDLYQAATSPYSQDEESSGIIDMQEILGQGMFLLTDQAHYAIPGDLVEGGQLLSYFNPATYYAAPHKFVVNGGGSYCAGSVGKEISLSSSEKGVNYQLVLNGTQNIGNSIAGTGDALNFGVQTLAGNYTVSASNSKTGVSSTMQGMATISILSAPIVEAGNNKNVYVGYSPLACVTLTAGISGGQAPYTTLWSTGASSASIPVCPVTTTTYQVYATDANGCKSKDSVKVCALNVKCGKNNVNVCAIFKIGVVS